MKSNKIILAVLILSMIALIFAGCGGGTTPTIYHPPTITSLTANPQSPIKINQNTVITCSASDPDGDPLTYTWTKTGGTITGTGSAITWKAPSATGTYTITCIVSNEELTDEQSISIDVGEVSATPEPELIEIASGEIDLNEGGVVEVTDPNSELYGLKLTIEPQKNIRENKENPIITIIKFFLNSEVANCRLPDGQGFLITPFIITLSSDNAGLLTGAYSGKLEIPYHMEQLINAGVAINSPVKLCRVPSQSCPWEEVSSDKYMASDNIVNITIGEGDLGYTYTLTVKNTATPNPSENPQPGDLLYKSSRWGTNEGWLPGHVGIYVGERYDEEYGKYNVIEALLVLLGDGVTRSYYPNISSFGGDSLYLGAREIKGLSHQKRNLIIEFVDNDEVIGKPYALFQTLAPILGFGLGKGMWVKGPGRFNCVGLVEAAYEYAGVDLVSNDDEGNGEELLPYWILTPAEQWYKTVPASGVLVQNIPPKISNLEITSGGSINTNSLVLITCNASDADKDSLTYIWTIPEYGNFITFTKGKSISWKAPNEEGDYKISCRVIDNYGGEDSESKDISVGGSTGSAVSSIEVFPETMNIKVGNSQSIESITAHYDNESTADIALNACTYSSNNTGVAIVDDIGMITAIALGNATITVVYTEGYTEGDITKTDTVAVTVSADVNHPPGITSAAVTSATKGQLYSYDVNATDPDVGDTLTYSLTTELSGMNINSSTGLITWTPTTSGDYNVTVKASDGVLFATQSFTVTVSESNHAPVISNLSADPPSVNINQTTTITCIASDLDGDPLTYDWTVNAGSFEGDISGSSVTWRAPSTEGNYSVECEVSDGELIATQNFTVTVEENGTSLGQVQLITPFNGATLPPGGITFSWNPVSNATKYQFILYNSLGQVALDTIYSSTFSIVALGTEETITWKIRAGDNSGNWGAWSNTWSLILKSNTPVGSIDVFAKLDGSYWSGSLSYSLTGPSSSSGSTVPAVLSNKPVGSYSIAFNSGGPSNTSLSSITPSNTQTLSEGGITAFTFNFVTQVPQDVTLILYICENSTSGPPLSGVGIGIVDGGGNSLSQITNSSGYVTITGTPGTWHFTAMKSGYDTNSWSQSITTNCTKYGYIVKSATPIGTIVVSAKLDGSYWFGSLSYSLTGPSSSSGSIVSDVLSNKPVGSYSIAFNSGGPSNASLSSISPSCTQTLSEGGTIAFTLNFVTQAIVPPTGLSVSSSWDTTSPGFPKMVLSWSAVSGATGYEMWVRPSGGSYASLGTRDAPYITFNSYSLPGGARYVSGTTYYFKVCTVTASGTSDFTSEVSCVAAAPSIGQVQLSNPSNGATISTSTVVLSWNSASGATGYEVVYDISNSFTNPVGWSISGTSQTTGTLTNGTTYYWRVRAFAGSQYSSWSSVWSFTKSSVIVPPTGLSVSSSWDTTSPGFPKMVLSWNAVSGATGYEMWVRSSGGSYASLGTRDAPYITFNSYSLPGGARYISGTTYYFKVRTVTASGISGFTSEVSCVAAAPPPSSQVERITNGSFSSGTSGWTLVGDFWAGTNFDYWLSKYGYAAGGVNSAGSPKNNATGRMYQTVTIPSGATSATLSFWYNITSDETGSTTYDFLILTIQDSTGNLLGNVIRLSNLNKSSLGSYSKVTFNATSYVGQTIRVHFFAITDESSYTVFRIDDVSLMSDG